LDAAPSNKFSLAHGFEAPDTAVLLACTERDRERELLGIYWHSDASTSGWSIDIHGRLANLIGADIAARYAG
jgi:hypothetical protein